MPCSRPGKGRGPPQRVAGVLAGSTFPVFFTPSFLCSRRMALRWFVLEYVRVDATDFFRACGFEEDDDGRREEKEKKKRKEKEEKEKRGGRRGKREGRCD